MAGTRKDKPNKWLYGWKLYVNYGGGWEYELFEYTRYGYLTNRKAYRENCTAPQRWSRGRELNAEKVKPSEIRNEDRKYREAYLAAKKAEASQVCHPAG